MELADAGAMGGDLLGWSSEAENAAYVSYEVQRENALAEARKAGSKSAWDKALTQEEARRMVSFW